MQNVTATTRRTVIVTMAALAVAVLLVWSASTGPGDLADGMPSRSVVSHTTRHQDPATQRTGENRRSAHADGAAPLGGTRHLLGDVLGILGFVAALWLLALLVGAAMRLVGASIPEKQLVVDLEPLPDVEAGREAVHRHRERLWGALAAADVRNGVVACWVVLEEAAAEAGVARRPAETADRVRRALPAHPRRRPAAGGGVGRAVPRGAVLHPPDARGRPRRASDALDAVLDELDRAGAPA